MLYVLFPLYGLGDGRVGSGELQIKMKLSCSIKDHPTNKSRSLTALHTHPDCHRESARNAPNMGAD